MTLMEGESVEKCTSGVISITTMEVVQDGRAYMRDFMDSLKNESDPRTRVWFFVYDEPYHIWAASLSYLLFVLWIGPRIMKYREPFNLRWLMIIYNAALVGLSAYMVHEIWYSAYVNSYNPFCQPFDVNTTPQNPQEMRMAKALWWYFFSKFIEFMDTIFMVLRKKDSQITFLHVFHHVSMLNIWWFSVKLIPGGQSWFATSSNSLVHVVMYAYYLLNMFPPLRKHLWWKRYLTQLQLTQFVLILINTSYIHLSGCDFPTWSTKMLISYMVVMLTLFGNFYVHAYFKSKGSKEDMHVNGHGKHGDQNGNIKMD